MKRFACSSSPKYGRLTRKHLHAIGKRPDDDFPIARRRTDAGEEHELRTVSAESAREQRLTCLSMVGIHHRQRCNAGEERADAKCDALDERASRQR